MNAEILPAIIEEAIQENRDRLPALLSGRGAEKEFLGFCHNLRVAGIGKLFLEDEGGPLVWHLHQSGAAFAHYLAETRREPPPSNKLRPFFDAVAAGDFTSAERIARRARRAWAKGLEYEEDFLFVEFLMQHFFLGGSAADGHGLLARYEAALGAAEDARLPICRALLDLDARAFDEGLSLYLESRSIHFEAVASRQSLPPDVLVTERYFSLEGLALLRLAESKGLPVSPDHLHVPSTAREARREPFRPDSWTHLSS